MQPTNSAIHNSVRRISPPALRPRRPLHGRIRMIVMLAATLAVACPLLHGQANPDKSIHDPSLTAPPDANAQMQMRNQQTAKQNFDAANEERKKQIANDSAKLLKLATDLKTEVDKTNKDTLSLNVIRKAEEIEKLAHDVKEKMKLSVGPG